MPDGANVKTLSIRVPLLLRTLITDACQATDMSQAEFISSNSAFAAQGVLRSNKALKLLPEWWVPDGRNRKMVTVTMYEEELELTKTAGVRMGIPHTRFILWAISLVALAQLGEEKVKKIRRRIIKDMNDAEGLPTKEAATA